MKHNYEVKIGIDLDNIVWDLLTPWCEEINKRHLSNKKCIPEECDKYDIFEKFDIDDISKIECLQILEEEQFWNNVIPKDYVYGAINQLHKEQYQIFFVTNSSYDSIKHKVNKLKDMFSWVEDKDVICIARKQLLNLDILIDDYFSNTGVYKTLTLKDLPYIGEFIEYAYNFEVCDNWIDILSKIKEIQEEL